jgi:hypothetical protein
MGSDVGKLDDVAGHGAVASPAVAYSKHREFCGNCGAKFSGHFCSDCGEERDTHRRSLARLLHDLIEDVLSFDSRMILTANALMLRPGELPCAFREGRLRRYVPPIRLYFFVTLLFFLTLSVSGVALMRIEIVSHSVTPEMRSQIASHLISIEQSSKSTIPRTKNVAGSGATSLTALRKNEGHNNIYIVNTKGQVMLPSLRAEFFVPEGKFVPKLSAETKEFLDHARLRLKTEQEKVASQKSGWGILNWILGHSQTAILVLDRDPDAVNRPLMAWIPRALFLLLPIFASLLAIFYIGNRREFYFVDHLVFSLNLHSFVFVILAFIVLATSLGIEWQLGWFALAGIGVYMLLAMKRFYGQGWTKTAVKFVCVSFIYFFIVLLPALVVVATVSALES